MSDEDQTIGSLLLIILILVGAVSLLAGFLSLILFKSTPFAELGWSVGGGVLSSLVVLALDRKVPKEIERVKIVRGHEEIYKAYQREVSKLRDGHTHRIRTVSSSPQSREVAEKWDAYLTNFLRDNPSLIYTRIIFREENNPDWDRRLQDIRHRYGGLVNYRQYVVTGPPSVEFFLVDDKAAYITFASQVKAEETMGIRVRDPLICSELLNYCQTQLEERYPHQSIDRVTNHHPESNPGGSGDAVTFTPSN